MDGDWQIGHKTAHEYGRIARETAEVMEVGRPEVLSLFAAGGSGL